MKILRVFPRRTSHTPIDDLVFIGEPPLMKPYDIDRVHISCTFTWDREYCDHLKAAWSQYYDNVLVGGPAYDDPGGNFTPGLYVRQGILYTSYGCNNQCPWCFAWRREGPIRLGRIYEGNVIQDNNLLQCPRNHVESVFDMLGTQRSIVLAGIEAASLDQWSADRIRGLRIKQIFLACDTAGAIKPLRRALKMLALPHGKVRCYVLLRHDPAETKLKALIRLLEVYEAGAIPFAQLYQDEKKIAYPVDWQRFTRTWQRPAGTEAFIKSLLNANGKGKY